MNVRMVFRRIWEEHGQTLINVIVFGALMRYTILKGSRTLADAWYTHTFDFVEIAFFLHNLVLCTLVLVRRAHVAVDRNILHQCVALVAFFSGLYFTQVQPLSAAWVRVSQGVTLAAIVLGTIAMLNLGRSFGILISVRGIKTRGLYGIIRHPMYFIDILWRVGIVIKNVSPYNLAIFLVSSAAYVYRALLEEKFLRQYPKYREYMAHVRYRFIPGVF